MGMYEKFTNRYPVDKTLRFELVPQGRTLEYIERNGLLTEDKERDAAYRKVKKIIDDYHREHIRESLQNVVLERVDEYERLYLAKDKGREFDEITKSLREQIVVFLTTPQDKYKRLFNNKKLIEEDLPARVDDESDRMVLKKFKSFTTYFYAFQKNRENMYKNEAKSTSIAYRVIDQNLPKYVDNLQTIKKALSNSELSKEFISLEKELSSLLCGKSLFEFFSTDNYCSFLNQEGIDLYNAVIGGKAENSRTKTRGVNEIINQYNQTNRSDRFGFLKPLYKQILSERKTLSFIREKFENDNDVIKSISDLREAVLDSVATLFNIFAEIGTYDLERVYISNDGAMEDLSKSLYGNWNYIRSKLEEDYDAKYSGKKIPDYEKYQEKRNKEIRKNKSYSLRYILDLCDDNSLVEYCKNGFVKPRKADNDKEQDETGIPIETVITEAWEKLRGIVKEDYPANKNLAQDKVAVAKIKDYLDALKTLQRLVKPFNGSGKEPDKDDLFYGEFTEAWEELDILTPLYNKIRNYLTRKPYSTEKMKLNFENYSLLAGWDVNKERDNWAVILRKDGNYYLGIMSKGNNKIFDNLPSSEASGYEKMEYKLLPGPNKMLPKVFFSKSRIDEFSPSQDLIDNYKNETHKKGDKFNLSDCHNLIDFFKKSIFKHEDWNQFDFNFSPTEKYKDLSGFYSEVKAQGYKITFKNIAEDIIEQFVNEGKLYLFQIYNKDFSPRSKGTPNLHTLYWKMLFDKKNLNDVVYKLNGEAEVFYRKASIKAEDTVVHRANTPVENKNQQNSKKDSTFEYDIIKDRRYTVDKFQFHVPITMNFKADGKRNMNEDVRSAIKQEKDVHIIGIDRGERNLLYICAIDSKGNIVEQKSLNQIVTEHNGNTYSTDYHQLLDDREKKRDEERKNWQNIETIKELKEGYLSIAIHEIVKLAVKYNAIIVLENLNLGFMRGRQKVEKQIYQKFEYMLINKLNYLVDKKLKPSEPGGLLRAYQLTEEFESFAKLGTQSGILFYTQAWNTSKIDPATGFVNLFDTKYKSVESAKAFWENFNSIEYDCDLNMFAFDFDYSNFTQKAEGTKEHWTVYSNGERIETKRGGSGKWEQRTIILTEELKGLFAENEIDYDNGDIRSQIILVESKDFHKKLMNLFRLILQMRNSISNDNVDYIISPVRNAQGEFYDSRDAGDALPKDADANGAYNIARKGLMMVNRIKASSDDLKTDLVIKNRDWLKYAQCLK